MIKIDASRVNELGETISQIPIDAFYRIDTMEPEHQTFDNIRKSNVPTVLYKFDNALALLGIGTGLIDYQQKNPAKSIWQPLERIVLQHGFPTTLDRIREIHVQLATSSRFGKVKSARVGRMYESGFASWFWQNELEGLRKDPYGVWLFLARSMSDPVDKKTIVMAMKAFDMETLAIKKHYLPFPSDIPIMVDSRITYVSLSSGIVSADPLVSIDAIASQYRSQIIRAWSEVINIARRTIGQEFNALRLDSLIWQAGEHRNCEAIAAYLKRMQLSTKLALNIAKQLIWKTI